MLKVNEVVKLIEEAAKPDYAYDWDNCGLLVGDGEASVNKILITLDMTKEVLEEAIEKNCQMIISHHPLIFKAIKSVTADSYVGEIVSLLYKNDISLYCTHTPMDICVGGVNDALCDVLEIKNTSLLAPFEAGGELVACGRKGEFSKEMTKDELIAFVKEKTNAKCVRGHLENKTFKTVSLTGGAGEEFAFDALETDVFITGEIKHHTALELKRRKMSFLAIGHYESEVHFADKFACSLQNRINMLQLDAQVCVSEINTNPFDC